MVNYFDTQEAYFVFSLFNDAKLEVQISYVNLIKLRLGKELPLKETMTMKMRFYENLWKERPLDAETLQYAADDVWYLLIVSNEFLEIFPDKIKELVCT